MSNQQRVNSVGSVAPNVSKTIAAAHAYERASHANTSVHSVGTTAASNAIKSMHIQKRKTLEHPKLMNRTVIDEQRGVDPKSVKESLMPQKQDVRHSSFVEQSKEDRRRDSAGGSLPSSRNFK